MGLGSLARRREVEEEEALPEQEQGEGVWRREAV